jgi:hypothetical protein
MVKRLFLISLLSLTACARLQFHSDRRQEKKGLY